MSRFVTSRANRVLAIALGVVVVVAVVAVIVSASRDTTSPEDGTPAGVVQDYLSAVIEGDHEEAADLIAPESPCDITDLDRAYVPDDVRVVLRDTAVDGDTAQVQVEVVMSSDDLLGGSEYSEEHTFRLVSTDRGWLVTGVPWPAYDCKED